MMTEARPGRSFSPGMSHMALALVASGAAVLGMGSCAPTVQERYEQKLAAAGKPLRHAVQSDRLRQIMDKLIYNPMPEEMDIAVERQRQMQRLSEVAASMAKFADAIPDAVKDVRIRDEDRELFADLARTLRDQATDLSEQARRDNLPAAERSLARMQLTCDRCHSLFRSEPKAAE